MHKRAVIVSGGQLDVEVVLREIKQGGLIIAVDRGLEFLYKHNIKPDYIVGDFDSVSQEVVNYYREQGTVPIRQFQPEKDASDTEIGVRLAIELECSQIDILGATGSRMDHVLANIQVLAIPYEVGYCARIIDTTNRISIVNKETIYLKNELYGPYFSVFSLGGSVKGLTMQGCKYPLVNHELRPYDSLSVSNQAVEAEVKIIYQEGILLFIESKEG